MRASGRTTPTARVLGVARRLALETAAIAFIDELRSHGVDALVLKGPVFADWLYPEGNRDFDDIDIIVDPDRREVAVGVLRQSGFEYASQPQVAEESLPAGLGWVRDGVEIDLHTALVGVGVDPPTAWSMYWARREPFSLGRARVWTVDAGLRTLHVATHAAQHGPKWAKPLRDLERALDVLALDLWRKAAEDAASLDAVAAFAAGLQLNPRGREVCSRLGLADLRATTTILRAESASPLALGLEELAATHGVRAKVRRLLLEAFPSPAFLRLWTPVARRGHLWIPVAYAWRLLWLTAKTPSAVAQWQRARRNAR